MNSSFTQSIHMSSGAKVKASPRFFDRSRDRDTRFISAQLEVDQHTLAFLVSDRQAAIDLAASLAQLAAALETHASDLPEQ